MSSTPTRFCRPRPSTRWTTNWPTVTSRRACMTGGDWRRPCPGPRRASGRHRNGICRPRTTWPSSSTCSLRRRRARATIRRPTRSWIWTSPRTPARPRPWPMPKSRPTTSTWGWRRPRPGSISRPAWTASSPSRRPGPQPRRPSTSPCRSTWNRPARRSLPRSGQRRIWGNSTWRRTFRPRTSISRAPWTISLPSRSPTTRAPRLCRKSGRTPVQTPGPLRASPRSR